MRLAALQNPRGTRIASLPSINSQHLQVLLLAIVHIPLLQDASNPNSYSSEFILIRWKQITIITQTTHPGCCPIYEFNVIGTRSLFFQEKPPSGHNLQLVTILNPNRHLPRKTFTEKLMLPRTPMVSGRAQERTILRLHPSINNFRYNDFFVQPSILSRKTKNNSQHWIEIAAPERACVGRFVAPSRTFSSIHPAKKPVSSLSVQF